MTNNNPTKTEGGSILLGVLVVALAFTTIGVGLMSFTSGTYRLAVKDTHSANATLVAEAGIETSLYQLNLSDTFSGYASEQVFFNNANQGRGTYTAVVTNSSTTNAKTIVAVGKVYRFGTTANPIQTRSVKVTVVGTASPGYSVHSGPGGLILGGSASITNADVYVGGFLTMSGSARIGSDAQPKLVNVANNRCPVTVNPGATYPQVCSGGVGGQPIAISGNARIYGSVCATGQTNSTGILGGSSGTGLQSGCTSPPVGTPTYNRAAHLAAITTTAASNSSAYSCGGSQTKTWPANLRLTGNVIIASSCRLTITGNVHITGTLTFGGSARVTVANSAALVRPAILVDGAISVGGSAQMIANNQGTGMHFISSKATASCNPDCTTLTGNDLKNSQNVLTADIGGSGNLPGMIFQAQWGKVTLGGSGNVGAISGQTVDMSGSGTIIFGTTLSSGSTTWSISSYQRLFQ